MAGIELLLARKIFAVCAQDILKIHSGQKLVNLLPINSIN
jgi:hypothetical protein